MEMISKHSRLSPAPSLHRAPNCIQNLPARTPVPPFPQGWCTLTSLILQPSRQRKCWRAAWSFLLFVDKGHQCGGRKDEGSVVSLSPCLSQVCLGSHLKTRAKIKRSQIQEQSCGLNKILASKIHTKQHEIFWAIFRQPGTKSNSRELNVFTLFTELPI